MQVVKIIISILAVTFLSCFAQQPFQTQLFILNTSVAQEFRNFYFKLSIPINLVQEQRVFNNRIFVQKRAYSLYAFDIFDIFIINLTVSLTAVTLMKLFKLILLVSFKFLIHCQNCQFSREATRWSFTKHSIYSYRRKLYSLYIVIFPQLLSAVVILK